MSNNVSLVDVEHYEEEAYDKLMEDCMYIHEFEEISWTDPFLNYNIQTEEKEKKKGKKKNKKAKSIIYDPIIADLCTELVYDESKYNQFHPPIMVFLPDPIIM